MSPRPQVHSNGRTHNGAAPRRKLVLVLEDFASIGGLIAALLRQDGYRTVRTWDLQEALRVARGRNPDLILLDLNLAYPAGLDILHELRANDATRRVPVVVVGGQVTLRSEEEEDVVEVVPKPFDIDVMLNAVRRALGDPVVEVEPRQFDAQDHFLHGY